MPLSYSQNRLWFLDQYSGGKNNNYNIVFAIKLTGEVRVDLLEEGINFLIERHESFRTVFYQDTEGTPYQKILPYDSKDKVNLIPEDIEEQELLNRLRRESQYAFDLSKEQLIKTKLFRQPGNKYVLFINQHHIISDGWSIGIFLRELATIYNALIARGKIELAPLKIQYADYAVWQGKFIRKENLQEQLHYWKNKLSGYEDINLPSDKPSTLYNIIIRIIT